MFGAVAQPESKLALPSITRTTYILMFAALMLAHTAAVRASIADGVVVKRFWVFNPSVSRMMTFSTSGRTGLPSVNGSFDVSADHAHIAPMVTLVVPFGVMLSTMPSSAVQSLVSGTACASVPQFTAGK